MSGIPPGRRYRVRMSERTVVRIRVKIRKGLPYGQAST